MSATDRDPARPEWEDLNAFGRAEERALGDRSEFADHPEFWSGTYADIAEVLGKAWTQVVSHGEPDPTMDRTPVIDTKEG